MEHDPVAEADAMERRILERHRRTAVVARIAGPLLILCALAVPVVTYALGAYDDSETLSSAVELVGTLLLLGASTWVWGTRTCRNCDRKLAALRSP